MDLIFPPSARISRVRQQLVSNTAAERSIFTGGARTVARAGDRWRIGLTTDDASDRESYSTRAALRALRAALRGMGNRIYVTDPSYVQRGSFPSEEMYSNTSFIDGSYFQHYTDYTVTVDDRIWRATSEGTSAQGANQAGGHSFPIYKTVGVGAGELTEWAPYVTRAYARLFGGMTQTWRTYSFVDPDQVSPAPISVDGYFVTPVWSAVLDSTSTGINTPVTSPAAGGLDVSFISLSRCMVVDGGANLLQQSDELDASPWTATRCSVDDQQTTDPFGGSTADHIIEDSSVGTTHFIQQSSITVTSAERDFAFACAVKNSARTWVQLRIQENTGGGNVRVNLNLSTGALGTVVAGTNWANARAYVSPLGDAWWYLCIVGRKTNDATSLAVQGLLSTGDEGVSYTGDGASGLRIWRATLAQSKWPVRLVPTTTAAVTATSPTGSFMYLKGLPPSESGLLLPGDIGEVVGSGLHRTVAPLNSDGAGLGYWQFEPALRKSTLADNTPVILCKPMARCILTSNEGGWDDRTGGFSDFEFVFEESLDV